MEGAALEDIAEVVCGRGLLVGVDEIKERLADEVVGLIDEMVGEDGVEVEEVKIRGEEGPVWSGDGGYSREKRRVSGEEDTSRMIDGRSSG